MLHESAGLGSFHPGGPRTLSWSHPRPRPASSREVRGPRQGCGGPGPARGRARQHPADIWSTLPRARDSQVPRDEGLLASRDPPRERGPAPSSGEPGCVCVFRGAGRGLSRCRSLPAARPGPPVHPHQRPFSRPKGSVSGRWRRGTRRLQGLGGTAIHSRSDPGKLPLHPGLSFPKRGVRIGSYSWTFRPPKVSSGISTVGERSAGRRPRWVSEELIQGERCSGGREGAGEHPRRSLERGRGPGSSRPCAGGSEGRPPGPERASNAPRGEARKAQPRGQVPSNPPGSPLPRPQLGSSCLLLKPCHAPTSSARSTFCSTWNFVPNGKCFISICEAPIQMTLPQLGKYLLVRDSAQRLEDE